MSHPLSRPSGRTHRFLKSPDEPDESQKSCMRRANQPSKWLCPRF
ncbi:hypothetical protein CGRA01v4_13145 [Colletotrichum graminicola]|nr:hypothetical protein CGRA01v4_13145 [Colletotrichum graminicola]